MKTAVASLVRGHRSYSALSRFRGLSTDSQRHAIRTPVRDAQRFLVPRRTITSSASRFQSNDSKPPEERAFGLRTTPDPPTTHSAAEQSTSERSASEQSTSKQPPTEQNARQPLASRQTTSERSAPELPEVKSPYSTDRSPKKTWLDKQLSFPEEEVEDDYEFIGEDPDAIHDGSKGPFNEQGLDPDRPARGRKPPQRAPRPELEPRLYMTKQHPDDLGFTPQPLTAPRGEQYRANPYAEEEEVVRPLTDRHMGSEEMGTPDDKAKAEIAARKAREPSYQLTFTCAKCQCCSTHLISKQAYHGGTVIVNCPDCKNKHLISDHLGVSVRLV